MERKKYINLSDFKQEVAFIMLIFRGCQNIWHLYLGSVGQKTTWKICLNQKQRD